MRRVASGRHAQLLMDVQGNFTLTDLGSTNGTYVNGTLLASAQRLRSGDVVRIGQTDLRYER